MSQVFRGVIRWGEAHLGEGGLKAAVCDLVPHVRYPFISPDDLEREVEPSGAVPVEFLFEASQHHLETGGMKVQLMCVASNGTDQTQMVLKGKRVTPRKRPRMGGEWTRLMT